MNNFTNEGLGINEVYLCDEGFNFATITGIFFILIFILSVTGNVLLLCVIFIYDTLKNVTNFFVLNLACSNLVFTATLPFWATYYLHHWVFGNFLCKFMIAAYFTGLYSGIILLTALTVDRFITVVLHKWPNNSATRQKYVAVVCAAAWVIGIGASLSDVINVKATTQWNDLTTCQSDVDDDKLGFYLQLSLLFILPFAIIVFCYSAILKTVLQCSSRKQHRTVVVVFCIVAVFFICWGPYNFMIVFQDFYKSNDCNVKQRLNVAFHICQILAYSHCCMNPLLYMLSQKLRKHLLHLLHCEKVLKNKEVKGPTNVIFQKAMSATHNSAVILEMQD